MYQSPGEAYMYINSQKTAEELWQRFKGKFSLPVYKTNNHRQKLQFQRNDDFRKGNSKNRR